ncbi:MAG: alpha-1,2-fucosyltransferase [Cytophagales bacterium]|nr:alpha-1,2-fucosyltransferase [Cytophagales bacterium]
MITVRLMGGMGNQMFQYALARHLAEKNNTTVQIDTNYLTDRTPRPHFVFRDYDLDIFNINATIVNNILPGNKWADKLFLFYKKLQNKLLIENKFEFIASYLQKPDGTYIYYGYYQSYKYFEAVANTIRQDFTFKAPILEASLPLLENILNTPSVCVNVRRTDFVQHSNLYNKTYLCERDYYERALKILLFKVQKPHLYIFSDEPEWCKENLLFDLPVTYIGHEHKGHKFGNYLNLMSMCKHFIIPNSSFAWWAAWLSGSHTVIAPHTWLMDGRSHKLSDIYPPHWHTIPNNTEAMI